MSFTPASLRFFRQLATNNNKQWFEAHRDDYEQHVREPMRELVEEMFARFRTFAPEVGGDPKRSMFRINRDVRFSKDKSPYKTHAACWFHHRGATRNVGTEAEAGSAGFHFHLEPGGNSMIGAGVWMPPRPQLNRVRDSIAEKPEPFLAVARGLPKRFGGIHEYSTLKRMPRGYDENHPAAKWLKLQSFTSGRSLADSDVTGAKLGSLLAREYQALLPLVRWINGAFGLSDKP